MSVRNLLSWGNVVAPISYLRIPLSTTIFLFVFVFIFARARFVSLILLDLGYGLFLVL